MRSLYPVLHVLSLVILIFGLTMLVPLAVSWGLRDGAERAFDEAILLTLAVGALLGYVTRKSKRDLRIRDGFLMVALVWTVLPAFAAVPLIAQLDLSFTDAYFETVSGLTTTGATILTGLDALPVSINFWRTQLVWLGGMGLIVLAVAVLPLLGIGGRQMFKAETPGPMKDSKMTPRIAETAKGLWGVYAGFSLCCMLAYHWAGMPWLDAIMHTFSTMGLGGFSSHDASFGYFNSVAIESVAIIFMLIAGMNFATHFIALSGRSLRAYRVDPEAGWYLAVTLGSVVGIAIFLMAHQVYPDAGEAFRRAAFNVISIATTTGFATVDYALWPMFAPLWMLFLCSFATSAGSTGGGIKMIRAILLYKQVKSRDGARHPSQRRVPGADWLRVRPGQHPLCRAGFRFCLRRLHRVDDAAALAHRARHHHRLLGRCRQHQQHRPGAGSGRAVHDLHLPERFPDLGVYLRHAARPSRDIHPARRADARVLAQVGVSGG